MRDIIGGLRERLNTAEHMPALLAAGRGAFDLIRAISRICQARSDEQAATFTRAAASAIHGRNLLTTAPSMPRDHSVASLRAPAEATSLQYDLNQITGMIASLATDLASQLRQTGALAAHTRDKAACGQAAATAGHIRGLLTPLTTPADASQRHDGDPSSTRQPGLRPGNTGCSATRAVPGRGTRVTSKIAAPIRRDGRPSGSRTRPTKSRPNRWAPGRQP